MRMKKLGVILVLILITSTLGCVGKDGVVFLPEDNSSTSETNSTGSLENATFNDTTSPINETDATPPYEPGPDNETR